MYGFDTNPFEQKMNFIGSLVKGIGGVAGDVLGGVTGGLGGGKGGRTAFTPEAVGQMRELVRPEAFQIGGGEEFRQRQQEAFGRAGTTFQDPYSQDTNAFVQALQAQMRGEGPSLAQSQFASALEQGIASQQAQAATGGFDPMARRIAAQNVAGLTQGAARGAAEIRAQEQLAAQQQLQQALAQRQADQLQRQQLAENLRLQYEQLGFTREQAEQQAMADMERQIFANLGVQGQLREEAAERRMKGTKALTEGLGSAGAAILTAFSDMNMKENVKDGNDPIKGFLDAISAYQYDYKDGSGDNRVGVMAQDLEKSPVTEQMVQDTPEGKMVDYGQGFGAMMAALANLNERISKMEGK